MPILPTRLEEAALNAWPALQQLFYDGWLLRYAHGYTKRANSVNLLYPSLLDLDDKISFCEQFYSEKGQAAVFRLLSYANTTELDQLLNQRNYTVRDPTLVLQRDLEAVLLSQPSEAEVHTEQLGDWLDIYHRLQGAPPEQKTIHRAILEHIAARRRLVSLRNNGRAVACGMGVLEGDYFGVFDIVTDRQERNKGYGAALITAMLQWAKKHSARYAYLQVVETNTPARQLYTKLGFQEIYHYWYRVNPPR